MPESPNTASVWAIRAMEKRAMEIRGTERRNALARFVALWSLGYWAGEILWAVLPGSALDGTNLSDVIVYFVSTLLAAAVLYANRWLQDRRTVREIVTAHYASQPHPPTTHRKP